MMPFKAVNAVAIGFREADTSTISSRPGSLQHDNLKCCRTSGLRVKRRVEVVRANLEIVRRPALE